MVRDTVEVLDSSLYVDSLLTTDISCYDSSDASIHVYGTWWRWEIIILYGLIFLDLYLMIQHILLIV